MRSDETKRPEPGMSGAASLRFVSLRSLNARGSATLGRLASLAHAGSHAGSAAANDGIGRRLDGVFGTGEGR